VERFVSQSSVRKDVKKIRYPRNSRSSRRGLPARAIGTNLMPRLAGGRRR
jgi:hypothetical protein